MNPRADLLMPTHVIVDDPKVRQNLGGRLQQAIDMMATMSDNVSCVEACMAMAMAGNDAKHRHSMAIQLQKSKHTDAQCDARNRLRAKLEARKAGRK